MTKDADDSHSHSTRSGGSGARRSGRRRARSDRQERREERQGERREHRHARKERVLHTRISEQLSEDIRRFAEDLRVPASNLVRNVLEEVFTVVETVSGDVGELFDDLLDEAEGVRDRVRNQAEAGRERAGRRSGRPPGARKRRGSRSGREHAEDIETELREDEARETGAAETLHASESEPEAATEPRPAELFPEILGWQPLVLNQDRACGCCGLVLSAGESAFLGLGTQGLTDTALCGRCAGRR